MTEACSWIAVAARLEHDSQAEERRVPREEGQFESQDGGITLKRLAIRGASLTIAGAGVNHVLRLVGNLVLTRLLAPDLFGLMALVNIVIQGLHMFSDVGIRGSIIRSKYGDEIDFLNTAWTFQLIRGLVLFGVCCALAWPAAQFYDAAALAILLPVAGMSAAIGGFASMSLMTAKRNIRLGRLTLVELLSQLAGLAAMITWAVLRPSVWALVAGGLVSVSVRMALSHALMGGVFPRLKWKREHAAELMVFGRWILLSTALTFLATQGDRLFFGKVLTMDRLGVYTIAVMLATFPAQLVSRLSMDVVFPAYSAVLRRGTHLSSVFHRMRSPMAMYAAAITAFLVAAGPWLIDVLYDDRYAAAGWMLRIVGAGLLFRVLAVTNSAALLAAGRPSAVAAGNGTKFAGMLVLVPVGWWLYGLTGTLVGLVAAEALPYFASVLFLRSIRLSVWRHDTLLFLGCASTAGLGYLAGIALETQLSARGAIVLIAVAAALAAFWSPVLYRVTQRALCQSPPGPLAR